MTKKLTNALLKFLLAFIFVVGPMAHYGYSARECYIMGIIWGILLVSIKWAKLTQKSKRPLEETREKGEFFKACRLVLLINFSVMALVTALKVYYAAPLINAKELIEVSVFLWMILSMPAAVVVVIAILLRYLYLGVRGISILTYNIRKHGIYWHK